MSAATHDHDAGHEAHGHDGGHEHHILPMSTYIGVYSTLLVLTVLTVLVSYANLGTASLTVAMIVAVVKAGVVAGYFMHLKYDEKFNVFVFAGTLLFVFLFFIFTFLDLMSRDFIVPEAGNDYLSADREWDAGADKRADEEAARAAKMTGTSTETPKDAKPEGTNPTGVAPKAPAGKAPNPVRKLKVQPGAQPGIPPRANPTIAPRQPVVAPAQPPQPTAPAQPTQPTAPTQPAAPAQPTAEKPVAPTQPTAPAQPEKPAQPEAEKPAQPEKPEAEKPAQPEAEKPEAPKEPAPAPANP